MKMALPEKLNRPDEKTVEEDQSAESRECRNERKQQEHRVHGHDFSMDLHPERYPRESLSRLEEGILEDEGLRHSDDRLGLTMPDWEVRVDNVRNMSRLLVMLGAFLLIFSTVLLLWVGWDVRSGSTFFSTMCAIAIAIGLGLIAWGYVERQRVVRLLARMPRITTRERSERIYTEQQLRESDRAA